MSDASVEVVVEGRDETADGAIDVDRWCGVVGRTLRAEGVGAGRLDLIFVEPEPMTELNREHLGIDRPTDVLAFPLDGPGPTKLGRSGPPIHLGDIVICPEVAERQASDHTGTMDAELTLLVIHGVLHILGHDHVEPDQTRRMQARERAHLHQHGFGHPVPA